jgi:hypothetical protein
MQSQPHSQTVTERIYCTSCGQEALSTHQFCAKCGSKLGGDNAAKPPVPPKKRNTWKEDVAQIRTVGFWIALFITLPTLALPSILLKTLVPSQMGVQEAESIWQVLVLTAPLTAAVVIVIIAIHHDWFSNGWIAAFFAAGVLAGTTLLSDLLSLGAGVNVLHVLQASDYQPMTFLNNMVVSYYQIYGFWAFASSLLVGGFIAWIWLEKIMPRLSGS